MTEMYLIDERHRVIIDSDGRKWLYRDGECVREITQDSPKEKLETDAKD